ncbi:MAG: hypothetical protein JW991_03555 [Candidatus Pacebacteria bacterium]|nr:hypothetical protein [Candidatus Paceibacterota bacterium]
MINKIKNLFKKPAFWLIMILIVLIVGLAWLTNQTPGRKPSPTSQPNLPLVKKPTVKNDSQGQFQIQNIRFSGKRPDFPQKLALYQAAENPDMISFCQTIADLFKLQENRLVSDDFFRFWQSENYSLNCDLRQNLVRFNQEPSLGKKPDLTKAQEAVSNFASQIKLNPDQFELDQESISYLKSGGGEYLPSDFEKATTIKLNYQKKLDSWPIFQLGTNTFPFTVWVGSENRISKTVFKFLPQEFEKQETYPLTSLDQAITLINQGQGQITFLHYSSKSQGNDYSEIPLNITGLKSANLDQVQLVYFYSQEDILIPHYLFSGKGVASDQKAVILSIIIPAISPEYLE